MRKILKSLLFCFPIFLCCRVFAQPADTGYWHHIPRSIRYHPDGTDLVITNGNRRFTRALYGTNTAFRVEAGDLPEFAMYLPGMGGNLKFGLVKGDSSKWLINAKNITARYRPGSMLYEISDPMLGNGKLQLAVLAMGDAEGLVLRINSENVKQPVDLIWVFGGVSGRKFSRDGDLNVDPESSFYLKPEYCKGNQISLKQNGFTLGYGTTTSAAEVNRYEGQALPADSANMNRVNQQMLIGYVPFPNLHVADAASQATPLALFQSTESSSPVVTGKLNLMDPKPFYLAIKKPDTGVAISYQSLPVVFQKAEAARQVLANRIKVQTPDPYINTLGGVIGIAADAIWDSPTFMHGAIGWRMRLNGWRGPYVADVLGWHDRARLHFSSYAKSQLTTPATGPIIMDTALHLARSLEKLGTSVYSSGYISRNPNGDFRPHHYDMNLVYVDALLRHFNWTGDTGYVREMWPVIQRHLAWEKRNFDPDGDGLYDAYAAIWASDALQYSGGGVTHSSAYNYYANRQAAMLAELIGADPVPYKLEAAKILKAINTRLWMADKGTYAEYQDLMGEKSLHPNAALWTYYHALDSEVPDPFQAYQTLKWMDRHTPHIPVRAIGLPDSFYTVSTTNWIPYDWSLNNVATAEVMHTALASWQAGKNEDAFQLWKSELLSSMYLGGSIGNIQQISFYDAARGEAYRDFADPVAMTARSLVEGLFGIVPDALHRRLTIRPGFPAAWKNASLQTPDIQFSFRSVGNVDSYRITPVFRKQLVLHLQLKARKDRIIAITVNGKNATWKNIDSAIGMPEIAVDCPTAKSYEVKIVWGGSLLEKIFADSVYQANSGFETSTLRVATIVDIYDPQHLFYNTSFRSHSSRFLSGWMNTSMSGGKTAFLKLSQGDFFWWQPIDVNIRKPFEILSLRHQDEGFLNISLQNNTKQDINLKGNIENTNFSFTTKVSAKDNYRLLQIPSSKLEAGTNMIYLSWKDVSGKMQKDTVQITTWAVMISSTNRYDTIHLSPYFNDKVANIFKNQYLSPRPKVATLQLPTQGIGDWTHPLKTANIDDSGLRQLAAAGNQFRLPQGIPFATPSDTLKPNIIFTSQWDNYPRQVTVPLSGSASHAYFLMAGSTNPMQSRFTNGAIIITYTDGSRDSLLLKNPETWWPIEQDYMDDGYAFQINAARPVRVHLKTGKIVSDYDNSIAAYAGKMIDGGAATVLDLPLNPNKTLKHLQLQTRANDVVIGLMSLTLVR